MTNSELPRSLPPQQHPPSPPSYIALCSPCIKGLSLFQYRVLGCYCCLINSYVHLTRSIGIMLITPLGGERVPIKLFSEQTPGDGFYKLCPIRNLLLCGCTRERPDLESGLLSFCSLK